MPMVIWIIGMSGSGKTTLGNEMYKILKSMDNNWVLLDGDMVRASLGEDLGHSIEDRRKNAYRISNLCKLLDAQGINVIACVLSIFHDNQKYNREIFSCYKEIFLDVDFEKLVERDNKGLYQKALNGEINDFVGVDIEFVKPYAPDITIDNNEDGPDFNSLAYKIIKELGINSDYVYGYSASDRIVNPEKYQYTKYIGMPFLEGYMAARNKAIGILEKAIDKIYKNEFNPSSADFKSIITQVEKELEFSVEKIYQNDEVITKFYLFDILQNIYDGKYDEEVTAVILKVLHKFEVSKKIYTKYDINFKKSSEIYDDMLNYLLLINILILAIEKENSKTKKYIYFNTILKLNDLVVSALARIFSKEEILLAYHGLVKEKEIYEALLEEKVC